MKLLVVVLNYRITELTVQCLEALSHEVSSVPGTRVGVCENGTGPEAVERLRGVIAQHGWGEWAYLREVHPNLGFTGGNNVILREALDWPEPPEYFLLLNADAFVKPGVLATLVRFMDAHPEVGICGPRVENPDGTWQCSPFRQFSFISEFDRGLRLQAVSRLLASWSVVPPVTEQPTRADWVSGSSLLVRRQVLDQIGLLDEGLYTYFDDPDYCFNARRAGWQVWYVPSGSVTHLGGQSTGVDQIAVRPKRRPKYWYLARRRYFLKNHGALHTALADASFLLGYSLWRLRRWVQRKPDTDPPHTLWDAFRYSVFCTGFKLNTVPNPALQGTATSAAPRPADVAVVPS